jgi:sugar lactone lactonase YvrE
MLEPVFYFDGPMPTGVTVSHTGRIFVNFPRWGDDVPFTVAELTDGRTVPFPDAELNSPEGDPDKCFISVQSVVVDPNDRLWVLDTGVPRPGASVAPDGAKLVCIDLQENRVVDTERDTIVLTDEVALKNTYLNDVRFDLRRGGSGMAFITDSSEEGQNGIIVVDLAAKRSWRKLHNHQSTRAENHASRRAECFLPVLEGRPLYVRPSPGQAEPFSVGADGIAISADGKRLYYCPLSSRKLYSVSTDALADEQMSDDQVAKTVIDHGDKGASDGLESDAEGRVYCTNYEHNAILRRKTDGTYETVACDPGLLFPDTLSLARDGYLYVTANQLHRQKRFHEGRDLRRRPYVLFRVKVDAEPVLLR